MDETVRLVCLSVCLCDSHQTFSIKDVPVCSNKRAVLLNGLQATKCSVESVLEQKEFSESVSRLQPGFGECLQNSLYPVTVYTTVCI